VATLLLVEDNADNRLLYRTVLEHAGHTIMEAIAGDEGFRLARNAVAGVLAPSRLVLLGDVVDRRLPQWANQGAARRTHGRASVSGGPKYADGQGPGRRNATPPLVGTPGTGPPAKRRSTIP
jgi:hypothetical protein